MPDVIELLKADHAEVLDLLEKLGEARQSAPRTRERLRDQIATLLKTHTQLEEELFYPALREAGEKDGDEQMLLEAKEEHGLADEVLVKLTADTVDDNTFDAHAKLLKDLVEHHAQEEEKEMFPRARTLLPKERRQQLGEEIAARRKTLLAA